MVTPNLKIEEVFKRVRVDVAKASEKKQTPWESSSLMGDFYFNSGRSISVVARPSSVEKPAGKKTQQKRRPPEAVGGTNFKTRELRYAKSLYERGKKSEAKRIVSALLQKDDETILAEAMYCQILWDFAGNDRETVEKLKAYYPDFRWLASAEQVVAGREKKRKAGFANTIGMKFVYIQPGTFMMGSPSSEPGRDDDERQHRVTLTRGYKMQTTEVTQGQWRAVMGSNRSKFKNCGDNCPVEQVSWNDAQEFIRVLDQKEGTNRYRLPTEAEWEYAARAGSSTVFTNGGITEFKCGYDSKLDAMGWYCGNSGVTYGGCYDASTWGGPKCGGTHPVAGKQSNALGLYDMHGNVWEWCQDWKGDYPAGSVTDPTGPSSGSNRVNRGGSWNNNARNCRPANRNRNKPGNRNNDLGFRLALSPAHQTRWMPVC